MVHLNLTEAANGTITRSHRGEETCLLSEGQGTRDPVRRGQEHEETQLQGANLSASALPWSMGRHNSVAPQLCDGCSEPLPL